MGSGILLLTAIEMADQMFKPENKDKDFVLYAVDISDRGLKGLMEYIRGQVLKAAEKRINVLRELYVLRSDLIENGDIINQYVLDVMSIIRPATNMAVANDVSLVFEAISENAELKIKILSAINKNNPHKPWFFTNTSSIPITFLDEKAGLEGRVLGVHFYNPPAVQKLVEVIPSKHSVPELSAFAQTYIKNMRKVLVPSNDVPGFIGNGHFMRDVMFGIEQSKSLTNELSLPEAVYVIDKLTRDYLVRPMGIYQLIDYVGIDVVKSILTVMREQIPAPELHSPLLDEYFEAGILGGQYSSGKQKDGFLKYDNNRIVGVYDIKLRDYLPIDSIAAKGDAFIGALPTDYKAWKSVNFSGKKAEMLEKWFASLAVADTKGAELAKAYHKNSRKTGNLLVESGVAHSTDDVNTVMTTGFFHAYGPVNEYLK
jgi:3-hydroxyacyl-CoA dehydrogenase